MEAQFKLIAEKAKQLGLDSSTIGKAVELIKYAEIYQVELYMADGKLRMRKKEKKLTDKDKSILDELSGNKKDNPFGDLFGKGFGDLFK